MLYVQQEFHVIDKDLKILIIKKLDGNAKRWFHSKPTHITMTAMQLLEELRRTYGHAGNYQNLLQAFKNRVWEWKQNEPFFDYYQAKLELGAGLNLNESQMVKHLIDGFNNDAWSRQARSMNIHKTSVLLERMQQEIEKSVAAQMSMQQMTSHNSFGNQQRARSFTNLTPVGLQPMFVMEIPGPNQQFPNQPPQCFRCEGFGHKIEHCPNQGATSNQCDQGQKKHVQCLKCKKFGHRVENCYFNNKSKPSQNSDVNDLKNNLVVGLKELTGKLETAAISKPKPDLGKPKNQSGELCKNCYRTGHTTDICQFPKVPKGVCHNCGSNGHMRPQCPYLENKSGNVSKNDASNKNPDNSKPKKQPEAKKQTESKKHSEPKKQPESKKKPEPKKQPEAKKQAEPAGGGKAKKNNPPETDEKNQKRDHVLFNVE